MSSKRVMAGTIGKVRELSDIAERCTFSIFVSDGRITVNAKSLIGMLNLDLQEKWVLTYDGENALLDRYIEKNAVD